MSDGDLAQRLRRRTSSGRLLPEVDGLRFLAIAPVVAQHLSERVARAIEGDRVLSSSEQLLLDLVPTGEMGVHLFFAISGFIICLPLALQAARAPDAAPHMSYRSYLYRRITRLEPPYLICMVGIFLGVTLIDALGIDTLTEGTDTFSSGSVPLWKSLAASSVYLHGLLFQAKPSLNPPAWSLEIEFQFYLVAPALILLFLYAGRRVRANHGGRAGIVAEVLALVAIALGLRGLTELLAPESLHEFLVTDYLSYFLLGFLISRAYRRGDLDRAVARRWASPAFVVGCVLALTADQAQGVGGVGDGLLLLVSLLAFGMVFVGAMSGGIGSRLTSLKWISIIGGMCYSIYLLHLLLLQVAVAVLWKVVPIDHLGVALVAYGVVAVPPVLVVCAAYFVAVEKPCMDPRWPRRLWDRLRSRRTSPSRAGA